MKVRAGRSSSLSLCLLLLLVLAAASAVALARPPEAAAAPGITVSVDGNDANPGTPELPVRSITRALDLCVGGEIVIVGPGDYDAAHGEVYPLMMKSGVEIYGAGSEATTVHGDASFQPVFRLVGVSGARIEGIKLSGGQTVFGGGVHAVSSTCSFFDVWFDACWAYNGVDEGRGGGVYLESCSGVLFDSCLFTGNSAVWGAAAYCYGSSPDFTDCDFVGNATVPGGVGGAVATYQASPRFTACRMIGNAADAYGAVYFNYFSDGSMERCTISRQRGAQRQRRRHRRLLLVVLDERLPAGAQHGQQRGWRRLPELGLRSRDRQLHVRRERGLLGTGRLESAGQHADDRQRHLLGRRR